MKFVFSIVLLLIVSFVQNSIANNEINDILKKIEHNYAAHNSISYDIIYKTKSLMSEDIEKVVAKVDLIRKQNDTNFGVYIWYSLGDSVDKYYGSEGLFVIEHRKKQVITFDLTQGELDGIISDIDGDVIRIPFDSPSMISNLNDGKNKLSLKNHPSKPNWRILLVKYPNEKNIEDPEMEITFDAKTFEIVKIYSQFKFKGELQTNEWNLSNVRYNQVTEDDFKKRFAKFKSYKRVPYEKPQHQFIQQN